MVIENLTQRKGDFREEMASVVTVRDELMDEVKQGLHPNPVQKHGHFQGIGHKQVADFIAKNEGIVTLREELMRDRSLDTNTCLKDSLGRKKHQDTSESIVLARGWLQSGVNDVKQFNTIKGKKGFQAIPQEDSYRSVAKFLSKKGKAVCYVTVKNYLDIYDKVDKSIQQKVTKGHDKTKLETPKEVRSARKV